ncbi:MAG: Type prenyl endopeptidase Rce1-like [Chloroflexota bacterium]|jgi:membrane protease YdiL (CAAX protease family)|nr:Type prenyl endopeptidase Rce1-like [Chloroflexota bacterium]
MTTAAAPIGIRAPAVAARWLAPAGLVLALGTIVGLRWWATRAGVDPLAVGAAFGLALGSVAVARAGRPTLPAARSIVIGIAVGLGLALITIAASSVAGLGAGTLLGRPAALFVPWAAITIVVATAEEAILRGRLFDTVRRAGGVAPAMLVTTVAFALMHVPLYGWHVVPLDLAVGLALGGLRLATGGIAAPAAAHTVADLATWWL